MARADKCIMEEEEITVEKALIISDAWPSRRRKSLGFSCIECGKQFVHIKPEETERPILNIWSAIHNVS